MSFLKRTFWALSQLVTTPSHSTRLSSVFLLLVVLTGWIGAPLVHEIEHALERAELAHVHDEYDGVALRTGCDVMPEIAEEIRAARLQQVEKTRIWLGLAGPG